MINFEYGEYKIEFDEHQNTLKVTCNDDELNICCNTFDLCEMFEIYKLLDDYFEFKKEYNKQKELLVLLETEKALKLGEEICEMLETNVWRVSNALTELLDGCLLEEG